MSHCPFCGSTSDGQHRASPCPGRAVALAERGDLFGGGDVPPRAAPGAIVAPLPAAELPGEEDADLAAAQALIHRIHGERHAPRPCPSCRSEGRHYDFCLRNARMTMRDPLPPDPRDAEIRRLREVIAITVLDLEGLAGIARQRAGKLDGKELRERLRQRARAFEVAKNSLTERYETEKVASR